MGELDAASVVEIVREGAEADASVVILGVEGGSVEVLGFADAGSAFGDVASALDPSIIAFVYGRVSFGTDVTTSRKLVLLTWVGPETTTIERGRIAEQRAQMGRAVARMANPAGKAFNQWASLLEGLYVMRGALKRLLNRQLSKCFESWQGRYEDAMLMRRAAGSLMHAPVT